MTEDTQTAGVATGDTKDADRMAADHAATLDRIAGDLGAVEAAMRRLDDGTYGRCEVCGTAIPEDQLGSDPLAVRCGQHRAEPAAAGAPASVSEGPVAVLAGDDPLALGSEHPEG